MINTLKINHNTLIITEITPTIKGIIVLPNKKRSSRQKRIEIILNSYLIHLLFFE